MLELAQIATEAVKQSSITVAIPTGVISSVATLMLYKGVPFLVSTMRGKKNGHEKPGAATECLKHRDELTVLKTEQVNTKENIKEIKLDVKELLRRVPEK